ncbi:MAG: type IV secretory system conjugative DNA transfer family protein [Actinomycetota bacterium]|nr:type IV secretory system conjugative DNA transfer family protein [Actinomycetota bacterium]
MFNLGHGSGGDVILSSESHLLILGPPRCGKTRSIVIPNLKNLDIATVVTSTKEDIIAESIEHRRRKGQVFVFDPLESVRDLKGARRLFFSPISAIETFDDAMVMAHAMFGASNTANRGGQLSFWEERAQSLISSILLAAKIDPQPRSMDFVMETIEGRNFESALSILENRGEPEAFRSLSSVALAAPKEQSGIASTASSILSAYRSPSVLNQERQAFFDPKSFVRSRDTIFVVAPSAQQQVVAPVVLGLMQSIKSASYEWARDRSIKDGTFRPSPNVALLLDEMANIAPIRDLSSILSEGASQGVLVMGVLQDLSQARHRWGNESDGFITLFGNVAIFPGIADSNTLRDLSLLGGEELVTLRSRSTRRSIFSPPSVTASEHFHPKITPSDIFSTPSNEILLFSGREGFSRVLRREGEIGAIERGINTERTIDGRTYGARHWYRTPIIGR